MIPRQLTLNHTNLGFWQGSARVYPFPPDPASKEICSNPMMCQPKPLKNLIWDRVYGHRIANPRATHSKWYSRQPFIIVSHEKNLFLKLNVLSETAKLEATHERTNRQAFDGDDDAGHGLSLIGTPVLAWTSSSVTSGASSTNSSPSFVTSSTHKSVMMRFTTR
jgi:hypothetical protein